MTIERYRRVACLLLTAGCLLLIVACQQQMADQPAYRPLDKSDFFADGRSARPLPPGTVAQGQLHTDEAFYTGKSNGQLLSSLPFPLTLDVLKRGQERFDIYCAPCHDRTGSGNGMIVQRGYIRPPSYHIQRLVQAPLGHFFDVMTNGFGPMPSYADQVPPRDRWDIAAYIRALQLSQNATLSDVPSEARPLLEGKKP